MRNGLLTVILSDLMLTARARRHHVNAVSLARIAGDGDVTIYAVDARGVPAVHQSASGQPARVMESSALGRAIGGWDS